MSLFQIAWSKWNFTLAFWSSCWYASVRFTYDHSHCCRRHGAFGLSSSKNYCSDTVAFHINKVFTQWTFRCSSVVKKERVGRSALFFFRVFSENLAFTLFQKVCAKFLRLRKILLLRTKMPLMQDFMPKLLKVFLKFVSVTPELPKVHLKKNGSASKY